MQMKIIYEKKVKDNLDKTYLITFMFSLVVDVHLHAPYFYK